MKAIELAEEGSAVLTPCALTFSEPSMCTGVPHAAVGFDGTRSQVTASSCIARRRPAHALQEAHRGGADVDSDVC